ncbi:MAG: hypothetical protein J7J54_07260 [Candidatus Omnitrophica bacterium]|nr:hypothetical protein [Candidatus Omnitrophota bacterium]
MMAFIVVLLAIMFLFVYFSFAFTLRSKCFFRSTKKYRKKFNEQFNALAQKLSNSTVGDISVEGNYGRYKTIIRLQPNYFVEPSVLAIPILLVIRWPGCLHIGMRKEGADIVGMEINIYSKAQIAKSKESITRSIGESRLKELKEKFSKDVIIRAKPPGVAKNFLENNDMMSCINKFIEKDFHIRIHNKGVGLRKVITENLDEYMKEALLSEVDEALPLLAQLVEKL